MQTDYSVALHIVSRMLDGDGARQRNELQRTAVASFSLRGV